MEGHIAGRHRYRVISDNDYGGDPDGLVQLVHLLLSPSLDTRAVVVSHYRQAGVAAPSRTTADDAVPLVREAMRLTGRPDLRIAAGANHGLPDERTPLDTPAARVIVEEAMRDDADAPLVVLAGGSLTSLASAYLLEPRIADRLTLVWIGGADHESGATGSSTAGTGSSTAGGPGAGGPGLEYNYSLDPVAAHVVFNGSPIPIWQVPRDAYRQTLVSWQWLVQQCESGGELGSWLLSRLERERRIFASIGLAASETFVLGDSPLVLLTALQTTWEPDTATSSYDVLATPTVEDGGVYRPRPGARPMRVYREIDTRLMLDDFVAKLLRHAREASA